MKVDEEKVLADALSLPSRARAEIAGQLLRSLDNEEAEDPAVVESAWAGELARRVDDLESGRVKGIPAEGIFAELRARRWR